MDAIHAYDSSDSDGESGNDAQQGVDRTAEVGLVGKASRSKNRNDRNVSASNDRISAHTTKPNHSWKERESYRAEDATTHGQTGGEAGLQFVDHKHTPNSNAPSIPGNVYTETDNQWWRHGQRESTTNHDVYDRTSRPLSASDQGEKTGLLPPPLPWPDHTGQMKLKNIPNPNEGHGDVGREGGNYWQQYPKPGPPNFDYSVPPPPLPFPPPTKPPLQQRNFQVQQGNANRSDESPPAWQPHTMQQQGPRKRSRESRWGPEENRNDTLSESTQETNQESEGTWNQWEHHANQPHNTIQHSHHDVNSERPWTRGDNVGPRSQQQAYTDSFPIEPYVPKKLRTQTDNSNEQTVCNELENGKRSYFEQHSNPPPLFDENKIWQARQSTQVEKKFLITPPPVSSAMGQEVMDRLPVRNILTLTEHTAAVNHVRWNIPQYSHLLASASMDKTVKVWDTVMAKKCVKTLSHHSTGIKDVQWNHSGDHLLSCGFDKTARLCHVETGQEVSCLQHPSYVTCVRFHPDQPNVFISGTYQSLMLCWDTRTNKVIREFKGQFGQVLDLMFMSNGAEFLSSTDMVSRDSSDRTIIAWDFRTTAVLSNQIYHEKYTCPTLRLHPYDDVFVAQTNGDYIAYFSSVRPYKMNKHKRCDGHLVSGYQIGCDFSPHGSMLISGSSDGKMHFYDYKSGRRIHVMECHQEACTDVAFHPVFSSMIATCSWGSNVSLWQ